jgi:hypothetical protein
VYFGECASANILSFAMQVDSGADITYDKATDRFSMIPASGSSVYYFGRKVVAVGSEGPFYICDTRSMIESREAAFVQTVGNTMKLSTKREIAQARKAEESLARLLTFRPISALPITARTLLCFQGEL